MGSPKPSKLSPVEAFEAIQKILEQQASISLTSHAHKRARERRFTLDDIRRVLTKGVVAPQAEWDERFANWKYTVSGRDYDDEPLAVVVAIEPELGRITVITGKDVND